ncbi:basic proline-rich protein-like [Phalacrocorax carbo]|uniref:basic proline-rich protein-like n=1 Tax=Phalacrocorax carbo TaxID=9209 RepID=UPI00311A720D
MTEELGYRFTAKIPSHLPPAIQPPAARSPPLPAAPRCRLCPAQAARTAADPGGLRGAPSRRPSRRRSQPLRRELLPHPRPRGGCSTPGPAPRPVPPDPAAPGPGGLRRLRPPLLGAGERPAGRPPAAGGDGAARGPRRSPRDPPRSARGGALPAAAPRTRAAPRTHPAASVGCAPRAWPAGRAGGSGRRTPSGGGGPGGGGGVPLAPPSLFSGLITSAISKPGPGCECGAPGARAAAGVRRGSPPTHLQRHRARLGPRPRAVPWGGGCPCVCVPLLPPRSAPPGGSFGGPGASPIPVLSFAPPPRGGGAPPAAARPRARVPPGKPHPDPTQNGSVHQRPPNSRPVAGTLRQSVSQARPARCPSAAGVPGDGCIPATCNCPPGTRDPDRDPAWGESHGRSLVQVLPTQPRL